LRLLRRGVEKHHDARDDEENKKDND